jgi:hypothetical protein
MCGELMIEALLFIAALVIGCLLARAAAESDSRQDFW